MFKECTTTFSGAPNPSGLPAKNWDSVDHSLLSEMHNNAMHGCQKFGVEKGKVRFEARVVEMITFPSVSWKVMLSSNLSTCTSEQRAW